MNAIVPAAPGKAFPKEWGKRRFRPGPSITSLHALIDALADGHWIYFQDRPKHPSVLSNMSLGTLRGACLYGRLRFALENPK